MSTSQVEAEMRHRRVRLLGIIGLAVAVLLAALLYHLLTKKKPARAPAAQSVKIAKAVSGDMPETLSELGTVTPTATVTVLPQLSGYLTQVGYKEGQSVVKGQFLAQIDPRQYEIDLQQAQAQLLKDQSTLAQARSDLARFETLRGQKAIAEQTVTDAEFAAEQDEAQVNADRANVAQFRLDLEYCHITAPIAGRVGLRLVDPGNYVTASSSPGIVVITTMTPTTVQFTVAQNDLTRVIERFNSGAALQVSAYSSDNTALLATGSLYALSNQIATSTGTVTLRATFDNKDERLYPNEFVNIKILVDTLKNAVLVPTPAVLSGAPGDYVYLANADNSVSVHKVTLGPSDGKNTVILSGLAVGDTVVVDGTDRLTDNAKISVATTKTAPQDGADTATPASPTAHGKRAHPPTAEK